MMAPKFIFFFLLFIVYTNLSFSQGQVLDPSFRIPDNVMPTGFKTKEMSDTFKLKISKPVVTPFDTTIIQNNQNRYNSSRNESVLYKSKTETEIAESDLPEIIIKNLNTDYANFKKLRLIKIENSQEFGYNVVYEITIESINVKKSLTYSQTGIILFEK